ncbi:sugar porter family MFS transporter [Rubrobacter tropicus]|uniref:Sugar porter family MFS transporter n=1 Tax=Rubrobacter tropicus TaxID=2653851 RepID=A0A6G8Q6Z4_9ACTN|nr:sugar porter family MFS transporter [Rubrobacter tropicus]QIN82198.1 sugar porter family MFS transporter [Rubrobacter tropicus]
MSAGSSSAGAAERRRFVNLAAAITATGGLLFGYDTGVISGALLFIRQDFELTSFLEGIIVSFLLVGAMVGALSGGPLSDRIGRRPTTLIAAIIFGVGAMAVAFAPSVAFIVLGRFLLGLGVGLASMIVPLYIAEIAPADRRGALVSLNQLMITIGILLSYIVGVLFTPIEGWRWMFGVALIPALILGIGMFSLPESPRWLFEHGRMDKARQVLGRSRSPEEVDQELQEMQDIKNQEGNQERVSYAELLAPFVRPALIIGIGLAIFQQITGINTVIYYAPTILQGVGFSEGGAIAATALGVGVVNVGFTILAVRIIDRAGRRPLLLIGLVGMTISLALLGTVFASGATGDNSTVLSGVLATVCLAVYIASFAISLGPVFWLMISEIYPLRIRGTAMSVASIANWGSNFLVALTFPVLLAALGGATLFWIFAFLGIVAWVFIYFRVPETKNRSLEEIEASFRGTTVSTGRVR